MQHNTTGTGNPEETRKERSIFLDHFTIVPSLDEGRLFVSYIQDHERTEPAEPEPADKTGSPWERAKKANMLRQRRNRRRLLRRAITLYMKEGELE